MMATNPVGSVRKRSNSAHYPSAEHPTEIDPADYPEVYASTLAGTCLEPEFHDGDCLVFSKTEACQAGDFVGVWLHPDIAARETSPRCIKRLWMGLPPGFTFPFRPAPTNEVMPLVMLEQLNPPRRYRIPATDIVAVHKVIGTAVLNGDGTAAMVPFDTDQMEVGHD